jgi:acetoin utilization deacetylase AcuC-like enzyme
MTTRFYYSDAYVPRGIDFDTLAKAADVARHVAGIAEIVAPEPLTVDQLARTHDRQYVEAVRTGEPEELACSNGLGWTPDLFASVVASAGGAVAAALHALATGENAGSASSGLHHARRDGGRGFCTFNGLALAALAARDAGARGVLVVDLDAHCGGGTASILGEVEGVRSVDVAVSAFDTYAPGPGWTLDLVTDSADYLPTIRCRLDAVGSDGIDLVLYNAGMDPHELSTIGGFEGIDAAVIAEREDLVFRWAAERGIPVAYVLAGGYSGSRLTRDALATLHALTVAAAGKWNRTPAAPAEEATR